MEDSSISKKSGSTMWKIVSQGRATGKRLQGERILIMEPRIVRALNARAGIADLLAGVARILPLSDFTGAM